MIGEIKTHPTAYAVLAAALSVFVVSYLHFWPDYFKQQIAIICMGVFYFLWGVSVHRKTRLINAFVVLEYLAVAILFTSGMLLLTLY